MSRDEDVGKPHDALEVGVGAAVEAAGGLVALVAQTKVGPAGSPWMADPLQRWASAWAMTIRELTHDQEPY
jgi:hypothetical protein